MPRVNVSSSSSDEDEITKEDRKESLAHKGDIDDEKIQAIKEVKSAQSTRTNDDGEVKGHVSKKKVGDVEGVARMKSPPKPARVATLEPHHSRYCINS